MAVRRLLLPGRDGFEPERQRRQDVPAGFHRRGTEDQRHAGGLGIPLRRMDAAELLRDLSCRVMDRRAECRVGRCRAAFKATSDHVNLLGDDVADLIAALLAMLTRAS